MLRKSAKFLFTKNKISVNAHFEHSTAALNHLSGNSIRVIDISRQTGGLRGVVSLHAIFDTDLHGRFSPIDSGLLPRSFLVVYGKDPEAGPPADL
jgi:hypothetical protein